jgi:hypothetical protein
MILPVDVWNNESLEMDVDILFKTHEPAGECWDGNGYRSACAKAMRTWLYPAFISFIQKFHLIITIVHALK